MSEKIKKLVEDAVSHYFQNISWQEIVGPAILENFDVKTPSDVNFVNKLVDGVADALSDNISGEPIVDEIVKEIELRTLSFQQTPNIEGGGMLCSKCYRPNGAWASKSGNSVSEHTIMSNGKTIILADDF